MFRERSSPADVSESELGTLCRFPTFYKGSNIPPIKLAKKLRLRQTLKRCSEEQIVEYVRTHPDIIRLWVSWSDDKRHSPSWYFERKGTKWTVAMYPKGEHLEFSNEFEACAAFIRIEISDLTRFRLLRFLT